MKKIALIIGHNKRSKGAYSQIVGSEYDYWLNVAYRIKERIPELVDIYERISNNNYIAEMNEVLTDLNSKEYRYCLELHFNSHTDNKANGAMTLIYPNNNFSKKLSEAFLNMLNKEFDTKIRGVYESSSSKDRGGYGIYKAKHNYILLEPFFASNDEEALKFSVISDVVDFFTRFINEYR
ncbi:N-acetylmuramoyl-L-alanine amidase [Fusobacterium gastrosuis]|uniref:N-acetylmuramoyl-L-alanine amidase n=1 Tax=Fusobacterium gastrosuis TaxID=1755100 RepID=UPI0029703D20|nr:N-acetylmuramoyl-L-alanine amidase [Fusobacteriaceae bacterium]MDY5713465.1 N-acetylmuramoyl-L-alanine amidase [Fusobacterium gastrosuis]